MALVIPAILFVIYESQPKRHMNNSLLNRSRLLAGRTTLVVGVIVCVVRIMLSHGLPNVSAQSADPLVILSPGHGWAASVGGPIDSGAVRRDLIEKDINLDVAHLTRARLARCPVTVLLTRTGDDSAHTLEDVDEIVNFYRPALGVSIHSNASGDPAISGTEAWYTVNGVSGNDAQSQQLANLLASQVAADLALTNHGSKPETANRHGGLYIHWWQAPSALVELAYMDGDGNLLRHRRADFAAAIARAILAFLNVPVNCLDSPLPGAPGAAIPQKTRIDGFGIMSPHIQLGTQGLTTAIDAQQRMGIHWAREEIPWELVEPEEQAFRWQYHYSPDIDHDFDRLLSELAARNIEMVALLDYGPRYLSGNPAHGYRVNPSELLTHWQTYVQTVVNRFGDRIDYWEIENEMNSRDFWGKVVIETADSSSRDGPAEPDAILYAHMLRIAHDIIKQHDRNDTVILGGLAGYYGDLADCARNYQKYLIDLHEAGAWDTFDVVAIHPYHNSPDSNGFAPDAFIERGLHYNLFTKTCATTTTPLSVLTEVRGVLDLTNRLGPKPLWITEIGWNRDWLNHWATVHSTTADVIEAAYVARTYVPLLSEAGVEKVFWFTQTNAQDHSFDLGPSGQRTLGNLSALLANSQPLGQVQGQDDLGRPNDDDVYEYRFSRDGRQTAVLWKARGGMTTRNITVSNLSADTAYLYAVDALDLSPSAGRLLTVTNSSVIVPLNERPVFLIFEPRSGWQAFWHDLQARIENWWQSQQAKITYWWEDQRTTIERQIAQWLNDLQRQIDEMIQKQIEETLNQLCGMAFMLLGGSAFVVWRYRPR